MKKRVIILGSTGSVGRNTLDVLARMQDEWELVGLAAGSSHAMLAEQANRFRPPAIAITQESSAASLNASLAYAPKVLSGEDALTQLVAAGRASLVQEPVLGCNDGQAAYLEVCNQQSFISGVTVLTKGATYLASPKIGIAKDGLRLSVKPYVNAWGEVAIDLDLASVHLARPLSTVASGFGFQLQVPMFHNERLRTHACVAEHEAVLMSGMRVDVDGRRMVVLVRARPVDYVGPLRPVVMPVTP